MGIEIILKTLGTYSAYLFAVDSRADRALALTHAEHGFKVNLILKVLFLYNALQARYDVVGAAEMAGTAYTNLNRYQNTHPLSVIM